MPSVLFVCTANQYRSPLAAACFHFELEARGQLRDWTVESAGTWAQPGLPAAVQAREAAVKLGISLDGHVTRQVSAELVQGFDLVLLMEAGQVEAMNAEFPSTARKMFLLSEMVAGVGYNIPDPALFYQEGQEIALEIRDLVSRGFDKIVSLAESLHENSFEA